MKLLLKVGLVVALGAVGYTFIDANRGLLLGLVKQDPVVVNDDSAVEEVVSPGENVSTELDAIFMYLPFLGFTFEDVVQVDGSDLAAVAGRRFTYQSNVMEVYQLASSARADEVIQEVKTSKKVMRIKDGTKEEFVALVVNRYIIVLVTINDPAALLDSYAYAKSVLTNLGINFE